MGVMGTRQCQRRPRVGNMWWTNRVSGHSEPRSVSSSQQRAQIRCTKPNRRTSFAPVPPRRWLSTPRESRNDWRFGTSAKCETPATGNRPPDGSAVGTCWMHSCVNLSQQHSWLCRIGGAISRLFLPHHTACSTCRVRGHVCELPSCAGWWRFAARRLCAHPSQSK